MGGNPPKPPLKFQKKKEKNKKYSPNIQGFVLIGGRPPKPPFEVSEKKIEKKEKKIRSIPQIFKDLFLLGGHPPIPPLPPHWSFWYGEEASDPEPVADPNGPAFDVPKNRTDYLYVGPGGELLQALQNPLA